METIINNIINKKYGTDKGYLYFVDLIKEIFPTFIINDINLKDLNIIEMPEEYYKKTNFVGEYVARTNTIKLLTKFENYIVSEDELLETFLHEFVHALTSKIVNGIIYEGLNQRKDGINSYFVALNEGITQYIVNILLRKKSDAYSFETNIATQLGIVIGLENLIKFYSSNDFQNFVSTLKNINPDLDEFSFIKNIAATSGILKGNFINGNEESDRTRVKTIQSDILEMYLKTERSCDDIFIDNMLDLDKVNEIINQSVVKQNNYMINANDIGFTGVEMIKNKFVKMVEENQVKKEPKIFDNKREEFIDYAWVSANDMVKNISQGEIIKDVTDSNGERTIVTLTENGTYGYQVFEAYSDIPHYYAESYYLIDDLNKTTDSDGRALRYTSAKSRVQRNLLGVFSEYILDEGFHSFYINVKFPKESEIQVSQQMAGYDRQDPVVLLSASFDTNQFSIAANAQIIGIEDKKYIRFGMGKVNDDGSIDYDLLYKMAKEAELAKRFLGESSMGSQRLKEVVEDSVREAQSILYDVYKQFDLPILEGVKPNSLLFEHVKSLMPIDIPEQNKLT